MSRRADLEARRRTLLARCDVQRAELTRQLTELRAADVFGFAPFGAPRARPGDNAARHPLAWVIAIGGLLLLGRTREVVKLLVWARTVLAVASRVTQVVRLIASWRAARPPAKGASPPARSAPAPAPAPAPGTPRARSASG
jgi:hypothetical protein